MLIRLGLRNLLRNPRRTIALLLTIAMGTGSLFMFHGFNTGIMNQYRDNTIHARFGHGQINSAGYREHVYERPWEHWIEHWEDVGKRLQQVDGVRFLFPRIEFPALLSNGRVTVSGRGQAVDGATEARFFDTMNVVEGALLGGEPDGILLGAGLAHALDAKPGGGVTVMARDTDGKMGEARFTVVGVFHTGLKEFDDSLFRIQLAKGQALLATRRIETLALGLRSVDDWPAVQGLIKAQFPALEATPFQVLDEVYYQHSVDWLASQFAVINLIILSIVTLGIFNTVSTSILERKQEVGNLRANGESVAEVMALLGCEGLALGVLGSALGIVAALVLNAGLLGDGILMPPAPGITRQFRVMIEFEPHMAEVAFTLGVATAVVATLLAGIRVARMPIAKALRAR
jgi:putative ABC transport system permease protein